MIRKLFGRAPVLVKSMLGRDLNATELLRFDHMKVEVLYQRYKMSEDADARQELFDQIRSSLEAHMEIEESIFYPACREQGIEISRVDESLEEHHQVKLLLNEIEQLSLDDERAQAKFRVVMEDIRHHVREEEEELFPAVRKNMSPEQQYDLARRMKTREKRNQTRRAA